MAYMYDGNFGRYKVIETKIGEGAFCTVDLVSGLCTSDCAAGLPVEKNYAAKILCPEKMSGLTEEQADLVWTHFRDEILSLHEMTVTAGMQHPHIVAVPDYGMPEHYMIGHCFGIVEFAESDLAKQIEFEKQGAARRLLGRFSGKKSFTFRDKIKQFAGLASALVNLHSMDIVHRDFKPENLLIVQGTIKMADLGLATEKTSHSAQQAGTPRYSAPEYFQRFYRGTVHPASDVFSWAVVFYEFLTGLYPFEALTHDTMVSRIQQKIYSPLSSVAVSGASKELRSKLDDEIFQKCFSPTPDVRPDAEECNFVLRKILMEEID